MICSDGVSEVQESIRRGDVSDLRQLWSLKQGRVKKDQARVRRGHTEIKKNKKKDNYWKKLRKNTHIFSIKRHILVTFGALIGPPPLPPLSQASPSTYHVSEEWRFLDVGGVGVPGVQVAFWTQQIVPCCVTVLQNKKSMSFEGHMCIILYRLYSFKEDFLGFPLFLLLTVMEE